MAKPKIKLPWRLADPCPCGSGERFGKCCTAGTDRTLRARPFSLERSPDSTGIDRDGCYLSGNHNCSRILSLEHPISRNILEKLGNVAQRGFPGTDGTVDVILPASSVGCRVLCDRHNSDLSPLDSYAGRVFGDLREAVLPIRHPTNDVRERWVYIDGPKLEAFTVKVVAAHQAVGNFTSRGKPQSFQVDWAKLRLALMSGQFEDGGGMHICASRAANEIDGCQYSPLATQDNWLIGIHMRIAGFSFATIFDRERMHTGILPANHTYRPSIHQLYGPGGSAFIALGWRHRYNGRSFSRGRITVTPTGSSSTYPFKPLLGPPELDIRTKLTSKSEMRQWSAFAPINVEPFSAPDAPWSW